jgi:hypothetical protein
MFGFPPQTPQIWEYLKGGAGSREIVEDTISEPNMFV